MTAARKTGLLRFSASRCLALIVKEWHQIGRDPSALVIGVFLPLFMLLVCGFGISMDMKDVPVAIVLEERTPVAQRIAVDFTANPYFDAKVFYAKAPKRRLRPARSSASSRFRRALRPTPSRARRPSSASRSTASTAIPRRSSRATCSDSSTAPSRRWYRTA